MVPTLHPIDKWAKWRKKQADLPLDATSPLVGHTVGDIGAARDLSVVYYYRNGKLSVETSPETQLAEDDSLFIFTTVAEMIDVIENRTPPDGTRPERGPILVCGLGHTGYRIVTDLQQMNCQVVALDFEPNRLASRLQNRGVSLKFGDMRWGSLLVEAGINQATAIVTCTDDDMMNLQIALQARKSNPNIRGVLRIFDDELSEQLRRTFGLNAAYSTSALVSPNFVAAALNRMNVRTVDIEAVPQLIIRLEIRHSALYDMLLTELNEEEGLTMLLHARGERVDIPPRLGARLRVGDEIVVLATEDKLIELNRRNKTYHELMTEGYA